MVGSTDIPSTLPSTASTFGCRMSSYPLFTMINALLGIVSQTSFSIDGSFLHGFNSIHYSASSPTEMRTQDVAPSRVLFRLNLGKGYGVVGPPFPRRFPLLRTFACAVNVSRVTHPDPVPLCPINISCGTPCLPAKSSSSAVLMNTLSVLFESLYLHNPTLDEADESSKLVLTFCRTSHPYLGPKVREALWTRIVALMPTSA
jgi:hypothetical protein